MAGVSDGLDLPGDPGGTFVLHVLAPERNHGVGEPAWRINLEDLALTEEPAGLGGAHLQPRATLPIRVDPGSKVVLAPDLCVGDRLPEAFRGRADRSEAGRVGKAR